MLDLDKFEGPSEEWQIADAKFSDNVFVCKKSGTKVATVHAWPNSADDRITVDEAGKNAVLLASAPSLLSLAKEQRETIRKLREAVDDLTDFLHVYRGSCGDIYWPDDMPEERREHIRGSWDRAIKLLESAQ